MLSSHGDRQLPPTKPLAVCSLGPPKVLRNDPLSWVNIALILVGGQSKHKWYITTRRENALGRKNSCQGLRAPLPHPTANPSSHSTSGFPAQQSIIIHFLLTPNVSLPGLLCLLQRRPSEIHTTPARSCGQ